MVLQTHTSCSRTRARGKKSNWDPSATPKQVRRGTQPPKHRSRMVIELQAAEHPAHSSDTEALANSPITTRHCAYRNIYNTCFFSNRSPCLPSGAHRGFILSRGQMQMLVILCPFPYTLTIMLPNLSAGSWEMAVAHRGQVSLALPSRWGNMGSGEHRLA